ncbi:raffinose synthase [Opitutaceae bacterium TAV4]|nr:raffinose synthase [Opitutaceae bacterium TAV4]RRK01067.1 raffinose synthase [Opitutaceae bacterium TAV3]
MRRKHVAPAEADANTGGIPVDAGGEGVFTIRLRNVLPDANGFIHSQSVRLPRWKRCCYYAPFQRHAINPALDLWPEGYNQCHPLPIRSDAELQQAKRGGLFALFELADGSFLALLPLAGMKSAAWLCGNGKTDTNENPLRLDASHFGSPDTPFDGELPLLSAARARTPCAAAARAWELALAHPAMRGCGRLRHDKHYPEVFEYLGWCSFEEYKLDINERIITRALRALAASPVPVRWALIDDGHIDDGSRVADPLLQTQEGVNGGPGLANANASLHVRRLHSVHPHPEKFPHGWNPIRAAVDANPRLRWLGLWLNYNGYWGGIAPDHKLGVDIDNHLISLDPQNPADSPKLPGEKLGDAEAFYEAFTKPVHEAGFDFIKVDNQAASLRFYAGSPAVGNAVAAAASCRHALEKSVAAHFDGIIGCMAHNNLCVLHQPVSQVMRCSEDYKKEDAWRAKHHLHNSFGNMLWMGQTVWGDHDMFHSSDRVAGALMARSKAISGGPVYLSDHPDHFVRELITPLHLSDGRVLRPLAPAVPTPESVFVDPYEDDVAYRVIAPLPHGTAALAAYNLTHPGKTVRGAWHMDDLRHRAAMLPSQSGAGVPPASETWHGRPARDFQACGWDARATPSASVLLYDTLAHTVRLLTPDSPSVPFALAPLTDAFVILSPVVHGWALIGNPQKYLPPAFVSRFEISPDGATVTLAGAEAGPVLVWHTRAGLCQIDLPAGQQPATLTP